DCDSWPGVDRDGESRPALHVAVAGPAFARAALVHLVAVEHGAGGDRILLRQPRVDRREVRTRGFHQLLETVDDEVGLLVAVDAVAGAHDALEVEADAVGRRAFQRMQRLALR